MFIIWYFLFSILYLFIVTLNFFFCKVLKLNNSLFSILFLKVDYFFNFYNLIITATRNSPSSHPITDDNSITFKNLYNEFNYFSINAIIKNIDFIAKLNKLESTITFCILNNNLSTKLNKYSTDLNYISYLSLNSLKSNVSSKKVNLNFFFNKFIFLNKTGATTLFSSRSNAKTYFNFKKKLILKHKKLILVADTLNNKITDSWVIKFSPSNFIKYINSLNLNKYNILYLRKAKVFNKGRYSRNRQYYRTGVYWCLYVNIIAVVGIYFWFYRFTMNFGYLWWLLYLFIASFIIPKAIKYRFYNIFTLIKSISKDLLWLGYIVFNTLSKANTFLNLLKSYFNLYYLNFYYFYLDSSFSYLRNITGLLNIFGRFFMINKKLSIFRSPDNIYKWEFNNINYYYNSVIKSRPIFFEKSKQFVSRLFFIVFLGR